MNTEEIGGYFGFEQLINNEYYKNLIRLNTARNALLHVLKSKKIKKIFIPYFLCDSVSSILQKSGYEFEYYHINLDFSPDFIKKLNENEYLYVVNFYGQLSNIKILELKRQHKNIIVDNTHAFFQKPLEKVDTIYSCRKFFGVPDGAYLSSDAKLNEDFAIDISKNRMEHLLGRFEGAAYDYYQSFIRTEETIDNVELKLMSKLTQNILGAIDYTRVRKIRNENYEFLHEHLGGKNILNLNNPYGAFAYPFYIQNGVEVRKEMADKKIYIPTLWPNVLNSVSKETVEYRYVSNILPLPCDQRYSIKEMTIICDLLEYYDKF